MKKKVLISLSYVTVAMLSCALTIGLMMRQIPSTKLVTLENMILEYYPEEVDQKAIEDAAAEAMVQAVGDRWSYYVPAEKYAALEESMRNSYVGIGISLSKEENGTFVVRSVVEGGPAAQAGMEPEDVIVQVNDTSVEGMTMDEVSALIKGEAGTQVTITVLRQGEAVSLYVTRNRVDTPAASGELMDGNIGYVRISNFVDRSGDETIGVIEDLMAQGAASLLFDVRFNSGGYEHELIKVLDYLLPEGTLLSNTDKQGKEEVFSSDAKHVNLPMAVLINQDSYSAAELFAAVLNEYGAAKTVGEKTVGKGHYQNLIKLDDGSAVNLSVGRYFTSKGENLEGVGLTPDVPVALSQEQEAELYYGILEKENDPQLQAAVELLKEYEVKP